MTAALHRIALTLLASLLASGAETQQPSALDAAWDEYRVAHWNQAAEAFQKLADHTATTPASDEHLHALYGLACTWGLRRPDEDPDLARSLYRQIIELAPAHDLAAWSWLALARQEHLQGFRDDAYYDAAITLYDECIRRFPDHLAGQEAFIHKMNALTGAFVPERAKEAIPLLAAFISEHPGSPFRSSANLLLSFCHRTLGQYDEMLLTYIAMTNTLIQNPEVPTDYSPYYYNIASMAQYMVGDFATARFYYHKLIIEYPTEQYGRVFRARQQLKIMDDTEAQLAAELKASK
jgi:tetratricopeptide (TPR) repeat protein